jgi:hypothetical protein
MTFLCIPIAVEVTARPPVAIVAALLARYETGTAGAGVRAIESRGVSIDVSSRPSPHELKFRRCAVAIAPPVGIW